MRMKTRLTSPRPAQRSNAKDIRAWSAGVLNDPSALASARLEVGTAWVNQHRTTSAFVPFGGTKESGLGRQYSSLGLRSYMELEVVSIAK
jgi:acyl-CoA reductase-like NAD-dependent aldehyde dehydrogenase